VRAIRAATDLPIHTHSHATSGLAHMTHLKAVEAGATIIDTCVGAFAEGASHPTTQSLVAALAGTEYDTGLSLPLIEEISAYFKEVRKKYWQFESAFTGTDTRVLINQVPGGMISNLANQLKEQGALDSMDAVLEEIPRVREDLGFPPLVTPTSQIVGTQAALNVLTGTRYKSVTNEVKLYLQGRYGKAPGAYQRGSAQDGHRRPRRHHLPSGRPLGRRARQAAPRDRGPGQVRRGRADLRHVPRDRARPGCRNAPPAASARTAAAPGASQQDSAPRYAADEFRITLHGETYHIKLSGSGRSDATQRPYFVSVDGVSEEVLVEPLNEVAVAGNDGAPRKSTAAPSAPGQKPRASHPGHVTAAMPGTVVDVLVSIGQTVKAAMACW